MFNHRSDKGLFLGSVSSQHKSRPHYKG